MMKRQSSCKLSSQLLRKSKNRKVAIVMMIVQPGKEIIAMTKDAKSASVADKDKTFWRQLADLIVGGLTPRIRDHVSAALDAVNGNKNKQATAAWKPEMYCAKPPEIVAACTSGHHDWIGTPDDACIHCVLDLNEYVPKLHAELTQVSKVLDSTMRERERTGAELSAALDRAEKAEAELEKTKKERLVCFGCDEEIPVLDGEASPGRNGLCADCGRDQINKRKAAIDDRDEAIRLLRKARTLLMRTASSTDR